MTLMAVLLAACLALPGGADARQTRIVGGTGAELSQWPWVARVLIDNPNLVNTCTGTVVAPNVVLTAGHCASAAWRFKVITGATSVSSGGQTSKVSEVVRDPHFIYRAPNGADLADYDATLLKLSTPTTAPVVRLATAADASLYRADTRVSVAGWGWTSWSGKTVSSTLLAGNMALVSQTLCKSDSVGALRLQLDTADQFCALSATRTTGICEGDSGGPLIATDATGGRVEIGITIFNSGDCTTKAPDYFTNVAALSGWLGPEIRKLSGKSGLNTPHPLVGTYHGQTGQQLPVAITVARSQKQVSAASVKVQLRCTRLSSLLTYTSQPTGSRYWPRSIASGGGFRFKTAFRDRRGWEVRMQARFANDGTATGEVTITGSNRSDGTCRSGTVRWTAKLG